MGDWKSFAEQSAELPGIDAQDLEPKKRKMPGVLRRRRLEKALQEWQPGLTKMLSWNGPAVPMWDDSPDLGYVTDFLAWGGLAGLIVRYASLLCPDLPFPGHVPSRSEPWQIDGLHSVERLHKRLKLLAQCDVWLPVDFDEEFLWWLPLGKPFSMASVATLNATLDHVCDLWNQDRAALEVLDTRLPGPGASIDDAALHGLVVFCRLAEEATRRNLPMIVHA